MSVSRVALAGAAGYALGTLPSADVASRLAARRDDRRLDLRAEGSGNPGAANAAKVLGRVWGGAVLAADMAKGVGASYAGRAIGGDAGAYAAATAAVAGHIAPAWNGFRGGKGFATAAGACLAVFPAFFPPGAAVVGLGAFGLHDAERAVQLTAGAFVTAATIWARRELPNAWGPAPSSALVGYAAATAAMVVAKFAATRR